MPPPSSASMSSPRSRTRCVRTGSSQPSLKLPSKNHAKSSLACALNTVHRGSPICPTSVTGRCKNEGSPMTMTDGPRSIPVERFLLRAVGRTDVGAQRTQNEDAMYYDDFLGVYVVCDGMGGHASGQVASDIAIRTIVHSLKTGDPLPAPGQDQLVAAMKAANAAVF